LIQFHLLLLKTRQKSLKIPKGVIRSHKYKKDEQYIAKINGTKGQTIFYKTLHIKLKNEQHEPNKNGGPRVLRKGDSFCSNRNRCINGLKKQLVENKTNITLMLSENKALLCKILIQFANIIIQEYL